MRALLLLLPLLLLGCPKGVHTNPETLVNTKWSGTVDVTGQCDDGGYTGGDLMLCVRFTKDTAGQLQASVDWDSNELRDQCDYFEFLGSFHNKNLTLVRQGDGSGSAPDLLSLQFSDDLITGSLQVHPDCGDWPVTMRRVR